MPPAAAPPAAADANLVLGGADGTQLLANIMHFARLLRRVGFASGGQAALAAAACAQCGFVSRRDIYWALAAVFVRHPGELPVFAQAFALFWRSLRAQVEDSTSAHSTAAQQQTLRRLAEQLSAARRRVRVHLSADASGSASAQEALHKKDFEQMSEAEWRAAMRCVRALPAALPPLSTRRWQPAGHGRWDRRRTLAAARKSGGEVMQIKVCAARQRAPALVILADISASMSAYARMLVHLIAAMGSRSQGSVQPVHCFLVGTKLTPLRRNRQRDLDLSVSAIAAATQDWQGGTRLGACLAAFNRQWSRRCLAGGGVVLLATDGLERGEVSLLRKESERLQKSCRRLIWLNPLLRYPAYAPLAAGARVLAESADEVRSIHNVESLEKLLGALKSAPSNFSVLSDS